jgi:hypothetical protein
MTRRALLCTIGLLICLALPSMALASRAPSAKEGKAVVAAVAAYVKSPSSHAAQDNKVVRILMSTIDKRFASAALQSVSGNSVALLEQAGGHWKVVGFSPSQSCSLAGKGIRKELGIVCGKG